MALEIERKFLIKEIPLDITQFPHQEVVQGYFSDPTTGKSVRVRHIGEKYMITRKKGHGLVKEEIEVDISKSEFDQLRLRVENHFLQKTRYEIPHEGHIIELDIYKDLQGLKTAEVEFTSKRDAKKFVPPSRFGEELTMLRTANDAYIANHGLDPELLALMNS